MVKKTQVLCTRYCVIYYILLSWQIIEVKVISPASSTSLHCAMHRSHLTKSITTQMTTPHKSKQPIWVCTLVAEHMYKMITGVWSLAMGHPQSFPPDKPVVTSHRCVITSPISSTTCWTHPCNVACVDTGGTCIIACSHTQCNTWNHGSVLKCTTDSVHVQV